MDSQGTIIVFIQDESGNNWINWVSSTGTVSPGVWHNLLVSVDTTVNPAVVVVYLDDILVSMSASGSGGSSPFVNDLFFNKFAMPDVGLSDELYGRPGNIAPPVQDMSDTWVNSALVDFSVETNRRKFISASGRPVDIGSDCSTPTGTVPAFCFSGDASNFATNQGTGGAFTTTGTLTNASTSPSN